MKLNRLTVIGDAPSRGRDRMVRVLCDCGAEKVVYWSNFISEKSKSCGCLRREATTTHGCAGGGKTPEYSSWANIKERTLNERGRDYWRYGGRGIGLCPAWHDFETFFRDMGPRPAPGYTVERLEGPNGYEPGNCVWP